MGWTVRKNGQINEAVSQEGDMFSYDEMHTAIVEIKGVINSRPLSYLNSGRAIDTLTPPDRTQDFEPAGQPHLGLSAIKDWFQ